MNIYRNLVLAAVTVVSGACAPAAEHMMNGRPGQAETTLVVQNQNWLEVSIYMVRASHRIRLGNVPSMSRAEFSIPRAFVLGVSDVTVMADPIGSPEQYVSPPIQVFPGARLDLKIENLLRLSNFAVYATS